MSAEIGIKLTADARDAQSGLQVTARAAEEAADAVQELNRNSAQGSKLADIFRENAKAVEEQAAALRDANRAAKEQAKLEKDMARLQDMRSKNSLGSQFAEAGRAALAAAPAAAAAGLAAVMAEGSQRAAAWEQGEARLRVSAGDAFPEVRDAVEDLSATYGTEATALLGQADRLMRAGMTSEQAVKAMESAVVAAAGDAGKMEGILDSLAEAASRGYLEEDLLGKLDEAGISFRTTLQEHLGMTKDELDSALSAGKIDVSSYFSVIDQLTGKGTDAQKAAMEATKSTAGMMAKFGSEWDVFLRNFGQLINEGLVKPLGEKLLPVLQKVSGFFKDLMRDKTEDLIADTPSSYQKFAEEHGYTEAPSKTAEQLAEEKKLAEAAAARAEKFKELRKAARDAANAEAWANMDLAKKRELIGRNTGLGQDVTSEALKEKLQNHSAFAKIAAGEDVTAEDEQNYNMLNRQLKHLQTLEKQEESARKQKEHLDEMMESAERRQELLEAELAGDKERVRLLQQAEEAEKLAEGYRKAGMDAAEAEQLAAKEVELRGKIEDKRAAEAAQQKQEEPQQQKASGWIQTSLASVGGGGVAIRQYENQALKVAQNTEKATNTISATASEILTFLQTRSNTTSTAAVLS